MYVSATVDIAVMETIKLLVNVFALVNQIIQMYRTWKDRKRDKNKD